VDAGLDCIAWFTRSHDTANDTTTASGSLAQQTKSKLSYCNHTAEGAMKHAMVSLQGNATRARQ
jgi:hypothetical protein